MYILGNIDDIIVTASNSTFIYHFIHSLSNYFLVKDYGPLHFFLGIELTSTSLGLIFFSVQVHYRFFTSNQYAQFLAHYHPDVNH